jgi:hypothetical protein
VRRVHLGIFGGDLNWFLGIGINIVSLSLATERRTPGNYIPIGALQGSMHDKWKHKCKTFL